MILDDLELPRLPEPLPRPIVDNHTHTSTTVEYSGLTPEESLDLAAQVGVRWIVDVGYDVESGRRPSPQRCCDHRDPRR